MIVQILDGVAITAGFLSVAFMLFSGKYIARTDKENKRLIKENEELKADNIALEKECERWKERLEIATGKNIRLAKGE
jgi:predicted RNase H-like nuclease (RuvC/YqgF family)